ncbi:MAG: outer membrane beta-barrel protein [Bacteroidia bacterium]
MKKRYIFIACFFISHLSQAQNSRWYVEPVFSVNSAFRNIKLAEEGDPSVLALAARVKKDRDTLEFPAARLTAGLLVEYRINNWLALSSGLLYNERGFSRPRVRNCRPGPPPNCEFIFLSRFPGSVENEARFKMVYLALPLLVQGSLPLDSAGRWGLHLSVGPSIDLLLFSRQKVTEWNEENESNKSSDRLDDFSPYTASVWGRMAISYEVRPALSISFGPHVQYAITPLAGESVFFDEEYYNIGVALALKYAL